jgi:hypothetical protein
VMLMSSPHEPPPSLPMPEVLEPEAEEEIPLLAELLGDAADELGLWLEADVPESAASEPLALPASLLTPPPSDEALLSVPLLPDEGALFDVTGPCVGLAPSVGLPLNRSLNGSLNPPVGALSSAMVTAPRQ